MVDNKRLEQWIAETAQGNMDAFEQLYQATGQQLYAYILSIVINRELAQDVFQDTYIKVKGAAGSYQKKSKPLAWLFTIAKHTAYDVMKKDSRCIAVEQLEQAEKTVEDQEQVNQQMLLQKAFELLNQEERQIVFLFAVSGYKHREIAELLHIPLGTVLWKYNQGIKRLRHFIGD